ncbi:helix-turn-helix transcriptional regulator [Novosphingobium sp. G106]|uniref:helix-turn-helix transcriptional regulator n=1 Tax=Novosphingobium sp. G106 TaxID=2849500 RepID=UPI0035C866AB
MEALTAAELGRGRTLEEIGNSLSIGLGTVRTHLKQILTKTETNRQAEAVAVIAGSVAAMPPQ